MRGASVIAMISPGFFRLTVLRRCETGLRLRGAGFVFRRLAIGFVRLAWRFVLRLARMERFAAARCAFEPKCNFCFKLSLRATFLTFLRVRFLAGFAMIVPRSDHAIFHLVRAPWNAGAASR